MEAVRSRELMGIFLALSRDPNVSPRLRVKQISDWLHDEGYEEACSLLECMYQEAKQHPLTLE